MSFDLRMEAIQDTILVWLIREDASIRYTSCSLDILTSHPCQIKPSLSMDQSIYLISLLVHHGLYPSQEIPTNFLLSNPKFKMSRPKDDFPVLHLHCSCQPMYEVGTEDIGYKEAIEYVLLNGQIDTQEDLNVQSMEDYFLEWMIHRDALISVSTSHNRTIHPVSIDPLLHCIATSMLSQISNKIISQGDPTILSTPVTTPPDSIVPADSFPIDGPSPPTSPSQSTKPSPVNAKHNSSSQEIAVAKPKPDTPTKRSSVAKHSNPPYSQIMTRKQYATAANLLIKASRARRQICYKDKNNIRHMPGQPVRLKPNDLSLYNKTKSCPPTISEQTLRKRVVDLQYLKKLHEHFLSKGLEAPRDSWEDWINDHLSPESDRAFMCLVVILMSSSTSDKQLAKVVPTLFQCGFVSSRATSDIALNYGMDAVCSLLAETGLYYKNAEAIVSAADYFIQRHSGIIPETITVQELTCLHGVGYKTATIVLAFAFQRIDGIPTDVHVHRCSRALGWIPKSCNDPDMCSALLESWIPKEYWEWVNPMFGALGQLIQDPKTRHQCSEIQMDFTVRRLDKDHKKKLLDSKEIYNLHNNFLHLYRSYCSSS